MKNLFSTNTTIDLFCKDPMQILESSHNGAIEILKNNTPVFYAITPYFFKKIFNIEYNLLDKNKKEKINKKFPMYPQWVPDTDFIQQAALWGIMLNGKILKSELACFISYWQAEGCFFYHIQWQQKLARSLQKSRSFNTISRKKRDITYIPTPDLVTPNGFRGK